MKACRFCHFGKLTLPVYIVVAFALFTGCGQEKIHLEDYYFPVDDLLREGKIYEYKSDNLNMASSFWYYKAVVRNDTFYLTGRNVNQLMQNEQQTVERRVRNGMLLKSSRLFLRDSMANVNTVPVQVIEKNLFPFSVTDTNGVFLYKVKWNTDSLRHTTVTRNRRFLGFEELGFKGRNVKCAKFELKELIEDFKDGYIEYPFHGVEYYGQHIGLIKYEKILNADMKLSYQLSDIYSVEEFEKKYNTKIEQADIF